jgi:hypothetical protein
VVIRKLGKERLGRVQTLLWVYRLERVWLRQAGQRQRQTFILPCLASAP